MKVMIEIKCDNAAFHDDDTGEPAIGYELNRIFKHLAGEVYGYETFRDGERLSIHDSNGNRVGFLTAKEDA